MCFKPLWDKYTTKLLNWNLQIYYIPRRSPLFYKLIFKLKMVLNLINN